MIIQNWSFLNSKQNQNNNKSLKTYKYHQKTTKIWRQQNIPIAQNPSQLESSHESTIIFEQEFKKHEMAQNMIFDNIIAPNKFMLYNLNIQKKLE
ncbi:hypothetical protein TTHERM_01328920 (macronuclear) [Tetrahymena thermophila SB210]|uniref:Uncharacterized protein n=1 Tax=Tetrahymena thermophila (strain SB210) TaxID=312017 RepID=Q23CR1_TETTS|nr:hypothetical protein TTHERM_01328920 [Tetrahymena thermophila SB210]EAR94314.2 hypothetical protein TTHERM_01328920 [Tetrahymena thermophila SB210]|eukprot:XP_001014559.2 hypothetical protein TTHERM_01328920 [Tetrahymena thermophila SB210]